MEKLKTPDNERLKNIEGIREMFTDPTGERKTEIARLSIIATETMQEIYRTGGNLELMAPSLANWLKESAKQDIRDKNAVGDTETVLGQILAREVDTRRFDHKFFGQIHPQGNEIAIISDFIAAYMNTNTIFSGVSMSENLMEEEALDWMADMFGYNRNEFSGNIVTGGTEANDTAFWVAREWAKNKLREEGRDPSSTILYVFGSEMKHYSIVKSCNKLGLIFKQVPQSGLKTDPERMRDEIAKADLKNGKVAIILGIAGGTETGMVDNLEALANIAQENGAHFHVDAAYGGPYILTREGVRFDGIRRADSITIDPHKMLYTPYESGAILFKDKGRHALITKDFLENAGYLLSEDVRKAGDKMARGRSYGSSRPSGSMGAGPTISTWATMKLFGNEGIQTILNHTLKLTGHMYQKVQNSEVFSPLHKPELNTLLFSLRNSGQLSKEANNNLVDNAINHAARKGYYISSDDEITHGKKIFRFLAMHPYSTQANVDELYDLLEESL